MSDLGGLPYDLTDPIDDAFGHFVETGITAWSSDGINFRLLVPFEFVRPTRVGGQVITVIADATTDGASVPLALALLGITRAGEEVWMPAIVHDAAYRGRLLVDGVPTLLEKPTCDLLLFEGMRAKGMPELKARAYFNGVVELGQSAFDSDRAALAQKGVQI